MKFVILIILILIIICKIINKENFSQNKDLIHVSKEVNDLIPSNSQYGGSGDKGEQHHNYLYYYKDIISRVKSNFKLLEIGISHGYSVVSFCKTYPNSIIYGVDINLDIWNKNKKNFKLTQNEEKRLNIIKHDATDKNICNIVPKDLDIILDDGSHIPNDIIKTFELLFKNNLKKGGIYIVEDIHCNNFPFPFLEYVKQLFPFTYKFKNFKECRMLSGKKNIEDRIKLDWRFQIKDITISRDIIIITKE